MINTIEGFKKILLVLCLLVVTCMYIIINSNSINFIQEEALESEANTITFPMEHCNCLRTITLNTTDDHDHVHFNETTCSMDSFRRGFGQKVIGFSFYGDVNSSIVIAKGYFEGIVGNLKMIPKYYPGWIMRLYFDLDQNHPIHQALCDLACNDTNLDICDARNLPGTPMVDASNVFPMNWRFFPTLDPQVDLYLSRDLDSRFSDREVSAVDEWLAIGKAVHSMRDHPNHNVPLLGAGWGADLRRQNSRERWKTSWKSIFEDPLAYALRSAKGPDQTILSEYVWKPWAKRMSVQHDSFLCKDFRKTIGFPTKRLMEPNNFIASIWKDNASLVKRCPELCRRYVEWVYC